MKYRRLIWLMLALPGCGNSVDTSHLEQDLLRLEVKIPLAGVTGRIDHLTYDSVGHRMFVAALGNGSVEVVDLGAARRLHSITGLKEPQGVLYIQALDRLAVAEGGSGDVVLYACKEYTQLGRVQLGDDADNVRYDGTRVYVGYGNGGIAVIDPSAARKVGDLPLQGHPEAFQLGDSGRLWINVPDKGEIVSADVRGVNKIDHWKNKTASANFPMALDQQGGRLFVAYRRPAQLHALDPRTGAVQASVGCVGDADDVFYDRASGLVFVSGGDGYVDVFRGTMLINHIATRKGSRTCLWLPEERKLVLAVPARDGEEAALWVYRLTPQ